MEWLTQAFDFVVHIDDHLNEWIARYGAFTYAILFTIIFMETGLVVTPVLPGDSLLFASGMFAAQGSLNAHLLAALLSGAAILGDTVNYMIGRYLGKWLLKRHSRLFKPAYMDKTHAYFEKYGGATIILARFVPIVRTFAPFVAGMGAMTYSRFVLYNVVGGVLWVGICVYAGFFLGNIPWIRTNFEKVILLIIFVSILPGIIEVLRHWRRPKSEPSAVPRPPAPEPARIDLPPDAK
jgi:membrane-associated protein